MCVCVYEYGFCNTTEFLMFYKDFLCFINSDSGFLEILLVGVGLRPLILTVHMSSITSSRDHDNMKNAQKQNR